MNLFQRLFKKNRITEEEMVKEEVPKECPDNWSLTVSDLMDELTEGKRNSIDSQERMWALDYERSILPADIRFPKQGDVYESLEDQTISFLIAYSAPFTGDGEGVLKKGDKIWIHNEETEDKPMGAYAIPVHYKTVEERLIPAEVRDSFRYDGFYFYFKTVELNEKFKALSKKTVLKTKGEF